MGHAQVRVVDEDAVRIAELTDRAIRHRLGPNSTFEQRQDAAAALSADSLWHREDHTILLSQTNKCSATHHAPMACESQIVGNPLVR